MFPFGAQNHGEQTAVFLLLNTGLQAVLIFVCELMNLPTAGSQQAGKCLVIALPKRLTDPLWCLEAARHAVEQSGLEAE